MATTEKLAKRSINGTSHRRLLRMEAETPSKVDIAKRTAPMSFSSEEPAMQRDEQGTYREILSHDPGAMNQSRINDGAPLLVNHSVDNQVGSVIPGSVTIDPKTKKARCMVQFSRSQAGTDAMNDVADGIRTGVSVGYRVDDHEVDDPDDQKNEDQDEDARGVQTVRVTKWTPMEVSLASVPADATVGTNRSLKTRTQPTAEPTMSTPTPSVTEVNAVMEKTRTDESLRVREIFAMNAQFPEQINREYTDKAVRDGTPVDVVRKFLLDGLGAQPITGNPMDKSIGMNSREIGKYSLRAAMLEFSQTQKVTGLYRECSDEMQKRIGQAPHGFYVPVDVQCQSRWDAISTRKKMTQMERVMEGMMKRFLTAGVNTAGGYTVQTDVMGGSFIELLRNKQVVTQMGARVMSGLQGNVLIPRQTGAATAYWLSETQQIPQTDQTFGFVSLTPKRLGSVGGVSKQLLSQSSVDAESIVRDDIITVLAIARDLAALAGTGTGGQPLGIINQANVGSVTFGGAATFANVVKFETTVNQANALRGELGWILTPGTVGKWKSIPKVANYPVYLLDDNGMANGYESMDTNQLTSTNVAIFGNWNELLIGDWGGLDVVVDPYTQADAGIIRIIVQMWSDVALRHAPSFCFSTDSAAQ